MPNVTATPLRHIRLDPKKAAEENFSLLNDHIRQMTDQLNVLMGAHGPIPLFNHIDLQGQYRIINAGTAVAPTDVLTKAAADPIYGGDAQRKNMEIVGNTILATTRRLNDGVTQHNTSGDLKAQGSIPPTVSGQFTYAATTTTITWSWANLIVTFADQTQIAIPDGSLLVTGLLNTVTYYFYPYYDMNRGALYFVADASGHGSPQVAFTTASSIALQLQNGDGNVPLSTGGMSATASGGGTGGGGGTNCVRAGILVDTKRRGYQPIEQVQVGEEIRSRTGWTTVTQTWKNRDKNFIRILLSTGDAVQFTPSHVVPLWDGGEKPVGDLCLNDLLVVVVKDVVKPAQIKELVHVEQPAITVLLACSPDHEYLVGDARPTLVAHNILPSK